MQVRTWTRRRWQRVDSDPTESDRGSTVAEAVIIVPVIIIVTLVVVQFVLWPTTTVVCAHDSDTATERFRTVIPAVSVSPLNAVVPPFVEASAGTPLVPLVRSQARNVIVGSLPA